MDIFDLKLLERAVSVHAERDSVEIVVNGVVIKYRKYLNGFDAVIDVELDGSSYYRNYSLQLADELASAKSFFGSAYDEDLRRRTVTKFPIYDKLNVVFAETANC
jgi:hypothetical protein